MITAVIIAGGVGKRMGQSIPKQFIMINNKPIIIYTLESFEHHPLVDRILVVCKSGWEETLKGYIKEFGLKKIEWIIEGGKIGQESINKGVQFLKDYSEDDDTIIIHDGIRPLVDEIVLSDVIVKCQENGNAVTSLPTMNKSLSRILKKLLHHISIEILLEEYQHHRLINMINY